MNLPEVLKQLRKEKGISQACIASAVGISTTQYQNYEYGKSEPTASVLVALANTFDVPIDYLAGRCEEGCNTNKLMKSLGENIRQMRLSKYMSGEMLAYRASMSPSSLYRIEKGESNFTLNTLVKIADAMDVDLKIEFVPVDPATK